MDLLSHYRKIAEESEEIRLFRKAAFSKDHQRLNGKEDDHRLPYKRDGDRIIHSKAYARYIDKTQVVYLVDNDHITHRGLHVQFVSSFSRGIGDILRLNSGLIEAIALGHDVGHCPFGHEGEGYLSQLSIEYGNGPFCHPLQSCRLFTVIEPLNLGLHVYDGFLCHDGGMNGPVLEPVFNKTWDDHQREKMQKKSNPDTNIIPSTLEGCLVKLCDTISYVGKDLEDAIHLGIISRKQIPDTPLGKSNRTILGYLAADIIKNSFEKEVIALSDEAYDALKILREFNFEAIYHHPKLKVESNKIKTSTRYLFEWLLNDYNDRGHSSYLWSAFLSNKSPQYLEESSSVEKVIDYLAGMTDSFFIRTLEKILVPNKIQLD